MSSIIGSGRYKIFIVEDNRLYARLLKKQLVDDQYRIKVFYTGRDCMASLDELPDLITLDYTLPDVSGHEVLKAIKKKVPDARVVIISAQESINTAIELMKEGADDYIVKDYQTGIRLKSVISKIFYSVQLMQENVRLKSALKDHYNFKKLFKGSSRELEHVFDLMEKAVQTNINVSLYGEPGTGKDLVAKSIHYNSTRNGNPYVVMNIAAIPEVRIGMELFGAEEDELSPTGDRKQGKLELANGGTLFLDDVDSLSVNDQARLMHIVQDQEMIPPGCSDSIPIDVRIISASQNSLATRVKRGEFRQDLYFHLLGLPIEIPPLRQRGNDIMILSKHFANEFCKQNDISPKVIADDAKKRLMTYHFPGNIRELKAIIEQACVMSSADTIKAAHLNLNIEESITHLLSTEKTLEAYQYDIIKYFLNKYNQNVRLVADKLGVGKSTIYRIVQKKEFQNG